MAGETVLIGSKLPFALELKHSTAKVVIKGLNSSKLVGVTFVTTEVSASFWEAWKKAHNPYQPLISGSIFETKNEASAGAVAKEYEKRKTGLEPLNPAEGGVKPATKD